MRFVHCFISQHVSTCLACTCLASMSSVDRYFWLTEGCHRTVACEWGDLGFKSLWSVTGHVTLDTSVNFFCFLCLLGLKKCLCHWVNVRIKWENVYGGFQQPENPVHEIPKPVCKLFLNSDFFFSYLGMVLLNITIHIYWHRLCIISRVLLAASGRRRKVAVQK